MDSTGNGSEYVFTLKNIWEVKVDGKRKKELLQFAGFGDFLVPPPEVKSTQTSWKF